jgi:hypothetical protein
MPVVNHGNPRLPISSFQVVVRNTFLELEDDVFWSTNHSAVFVSRETMEERDRK